MKKITQTIEIGNNLFDRQQIIDSLKEYELLHENRPIKKNEGGMHAPHLFASWFIAKTLAPNTIIESGVWKGQSTWLFENACPSASIHSIDLNLSKREYVSETATYYEKDFSEIDWSAIDCTRTLVFFDDHQNAYTRLQQCKWFGFRDIIFEDNFPLGEGDFYTMKMVFSGSGFGTEWAMTSGQAYQKSYAKVIRKLKALFLRIGLTGISVIPQFSRDRVWPNKHDLEFVKRNIDIYTEFPPVFEKRGFPSPQPLLDLSERHKHLLFSNESENYNGICFVRLKGN